MRRFLTFFGGSGEPTSENQFFRAIRRAHLLTRWFVFQAKFPLSVAQESLAPIEPTC